MNIIGREQHIYIYIIVYIYIYIHIWVKLRDLKANFPLQRQDTVSSLYTRALRISGDPSRPKFSRQEAGPRTKYCSSFTPLPSLLERRNVEADSERQCELLFMGNGSVCFIVSHFPCFYHHNADSI